MKSEQNYTTRVCHAGLCDTITTFGQVEGVHRAMLIHFQPIWIDIDIQYIMLFCVYILLFNACMAFQLML